MKMELFYKDHSFQVSLCYWKCSEMIEWFASSFKLPCYHDSWQCINLPSMKLYGRLRDRDMKQIYKIVHQMNASYSNACNTTKRDDNLFL